ncbi:MAG: hypothetical protein HY721_24925 [Planctomycetes bacterium]|nr:hypothetical protein [Planctomycetota bacterium]
MATRSRIARACGLGLAALLGTAGVSGSLEASVGEDDDDDLPISFELPEVEARPGDTVDVPLTVRTERALSLAAFSVEYEPGALGLGGPSLSSEVQAILDANPGAESLIQWFADEQVGWVQGVIVLDFQARDLITIPAGATPVASLRFRVPEGTPEGRYPLTFTRPETAEYEGELEDVEQNPIYNHARDDDLEFEPEDEFEDGGEPTLVDGAVTVSIIGDVSVFARGDANADRQINISDPVRLLDVLFRGAEPLSCDDSGDANDDGSLDLSDPVSILLHLFRPDGGSSLISPDPTRDLTPDDLGCAYY